MSQNYSWPSSSDVTITGSPNGEPIPTTSVVVGAENPSGDTEPLQVNAQGALITTPASGSLADVNIAEYGGTTTSLGQKASAASIPVVVASDQSSLPVTVGNFPATQPISGTVTANQGAANATPWNDNIAQWGGSATSLGSKVSASSVPVVIASDQSAIPVTVSSFPTEQAVNLNEVGGSAIAIGQAAMAASLPVAIASNQSSLPTTITTPTPLTITNAALTVGTSPVRLTVSGSAPASDRVALVVTPDSSSSALFYIGNSSVSNSGASRGVEIKAGQSFIANNDAGDYYIVASTTAQTITIMEQS